MANPDSLSSSGDFEVYASLAALEAAFASGARKGQITRWVTVMAGGLLKCKPAGNGASVQDMVFGAGVREEIQCSGFTATGSTATVSAAQPVKVYF